ncbi:MAG TPA: hypothetical protein VIL20_20835 [Sandaracinaceae bacterium]
MIRRVPAVLLLVAGCAAEPDLAVTSAALGEPRDGFPTWEERVVFVWTNRARADPAADLASCSVCAERDCYAPRPPLVWDHALARAARFHSDNLALAGCGLQHDSPCTLVSDLGTLYTPGPCDGSPSCACTGGTATCGSSGTSFAARVGLFGVTPRAENIATGSDPVSTFYLWLHEPDSNPACGWRVSNGHRANILGDARSLGVGKTAAGRIWTQDFGASGTPDGLVGGVHYPRTGPDVELRANWHRPGVTPSSAIVNVGGTCLPMTLERGSGDSGTYLATASGLSGCVRYHFRFTTPAGDVVYPSTGSFGIDCPDDGSSAAPPACGCTPSCDGRSCGDDGCGGSCGSCPSDRSCSASGTCVCAGGRTDCGGACVDTSSDEAHCGGCGNACASAEQCVSGTCVAVCTPSCDGRSCGDDGCGGSCGSCPAGRTCDASGQCVCPAGRTECGGACVDTSRDPSHCGGCGAACPSGQACTGGACACVPTCGGRECGDDGCGGSCGTCGDGRVCAGGACECAESLTRCGGECVDVRVDERHCGGCGVACAAGETCVAGACTASPPDAGCAPACEGRACGDDTCGGSCGACEADRVCGAGGQCLCTDGRTECDGACVDVRGDDAHCGACGAACAPDQRCVGGECTGGGQRPDAGVDAGASIDAGAGDVRALRGTCGCRAAGADRAPVGLLLSCVALAALRRRRLGALAKARRRKG